MKMVIVIAQKIDENDDHRSYFINWIKEFSNNFDEVSVIAIISGDYSLPNNVKVYSLGKENNTPKLIQALRFYCYLFKLVPNSEGIFAHSSPIFVIASWPVAFLLRKKIIFWYLHRSVTAKLKLAVLLCYRIVTASKESLRFFSKKIIETGHGIMVDDFKTNRDWSGDKLNILSIGRITKIKDYETLIKSAKILKDKNLDFKIKIVGQSVMPEDVEYHNFLNNLKKDLELGNLVEFVGSVPYIKMHPLFKEADLVIGLTPRGGIDKTILEGMASGCLVLTSNDANREYFGSYANDLIFNHGDYAQLANKIEFLNQMSLEQKKEVGMFLVNSVSKYHNLHNLVSRIKKLYE